MFWLRNKIIFELLLSGALGKKMALLYVFRKDKIFPQLYINLNVELDH